MIVQEAVNAFKIADIILLENEEIKFNYLNTIIDETSTRLDNKILKDESELYI